MIESPGDEPGVHIAVLGSGRDYAHLVPPLSFARPTADTRGLVRLHVPAARALPAARRAITASALRAGIPTVQEREATPSAGGPSDRARRITVEPGVCGGKPCVRGMRVRVSDVLSLLASGLTPGMVLAELPGLKAEDVRACLDYAARALAGPRAARAV